jgi:hypothetical protein
MNKEKEKKSVNDVLKYLIDEGFAVKLPNGTFRMKTKEELKNELILIENGFEI